VKCIELILKNKNSVPLYNLEILDPPERYKDYLLKQISKQNEEVDLEKIVGMFSREKHETTWFKALLGLRRRVLRLDPLQCYNSLESINLNYYTDIEYRKNVTDPWCIIYINEKAYISDGYHRTTIAKFLSALKIIPNKIIIPEVIYYNVDLYNLKAHSRLMNKISLLQRLINEDFSIEIEIQKDNDKIIYFLNMKFRKYAYESYKQSFDSIKELRKEVFISIRKYCLENKGSVK